MSIIESLQHMQTLDELIIWGGYALLFAIVFAETGLFAGFFLPGELGATQWEKKSWKLFAINTGYHLASLMVVASILTFWK